MQYNPEVMQALCNRIIAGEALLDICKDEGMPAFAELVNWVRNEDDAAVKLDDARYALQIRMAETLRSIGSTVPTSKLDAQGKKMHSENLRWLLEREYPDKYGARVQHDHSHEVNLRVALDNAKRRLGQEAQGIGQPVIDVTPVVAEAIEVDPLS